MVCGWKRDANGKTKNVIRFRASLSRADVGSISGIVGRRLCYVSFLEKKEKHIIKGLFSIRSRFKSNFAVIKMLSSFCYAFTVVYIIT